MSLVRTYTCLLSEPEAEMNREVNGHGVREHLARHCTNFANIMYKIIGTGMYPDFTERGGMIYEKSDYHQS